MIIRAYPFIARRRRSLTHKRHFLLHLFSKNFVFLNQIGYATALSCYFGYKLCVIKINQPWRAKLFTLPLLGGFPSVRKWLIIGLFLKMFKVCWLRFFVYAFKHGWRLCSRRNWASGGLAAAFHPFLTTLPWRLINHRFWKISSLGRWSEVPLKKLPDKGEDLFA